MSAVKMHTLDVKFTNSFKDAQQLCRAGYEPIECAFGQRGSVMGRYQMDHHGMESHREGVALRACRDHYAARREDPRFVVTGTPDADAVLAIIALAGLVPKHDLREEFYTLVNAYDVDPIGIDLFSRPMGPELAWFNHLQGLRQSSEGFQQGIEAMCRLLTNGLTEIERAKTVRADEARRKRALDGICARLDKHGNRLSIPSPPLGPILRGSALHSDVARVCITHSPVWGFDIWYKMAPIVISYAERIEKITIGVADVDTACQLFGDGGLNTVWPLLGEGWGGRESVGGSPRGTRLKLADVYTVAEALRSQLLF